MRILHVIAGLNENAGGTSEFVARICQELKEQGNSVSVLTIEDGNMAPAVRQAMDAGVRVGFCRISMSRFRLLSYSSEFSRRIKDEVRDADIVHLHGLWQWPCWRAAWESQWQKVPFVMQTHGFLEPERLKKSRIKKAIIGQLIERPNLAAASRVIATAESEKDSILRYGVKTPVEVVPIGMDVTQIDAGRRDEELLRRLGVPVGKKVLLYLSRLAPIKGLDMLADAWMRLKEFHKDWHLLIVGDDTQGYSSVVKRDYARIVTDGSACLPGPVYGRDKFNLLKSVDGFVLPTRSENFSIAVQEALAAGVPVVCTKGAPWSRIRDVGAGWWVDVSEAGITEGLRKLMSITDDVRLLMGERGAEFVRSNFRWSEIGAKMISVYESVVEERQNKR